jgi:hypothetical protein
MGDRVEVRVPTHIQTDGGLECGPSACGPECRSNPGLCSCWISRAIADTAWARSPDLCSSNLSEGLWAASVLRSPPECSGDDLGGGCWEEDTSSPRRLDLRLPLEDSSLASTRCAMGVCRLGDVPRNGSVREPGVSEGRGFFAGRFFGS